MFFDYYFGQIIQQTMTDGRHYLTRRAFANYSDVIIIAFVFVNRRPRTCTLSCRYYKSITGSIQRSATAPRRKLRREGVSSDRILFNRIDWANIKTETMSPIILTTVVYIIHILYVSYIIRITVHRRIRTVQR